MQEQPASSRPSSSERSSSSAHHMDMEVKEGKLAIFLCHSRNILHLLGLIFITHSQFFDFFFRTCVPTLPIDFSFPFSCNCASHVKQSRLLN